MTLFWPSCNCCRRCCSGEVPEELQVNFTNGFTGLGMPGCLKLIAAAYVLSNVTPCSWNYDGPVDGDGGTIQVHCALTRESISGEPRWVIRIEYSWNGPSSNARVIFFKVLGEARDDCEVWDTLILGRQTTVPTGCVELNQQPSFAEVTAL